MFENKYHNQSLSENTFLVTGGAGFIGSNIGEYLLQYGAAKVRVLDNFITGHRKNIESFLDNPSFKLITGDIRDLDTCRYAADGIDYVLHQAALGSVPRSINDPVTTNEINISGFLNMLVAARDAKVKRNVFGRRQDPNGAYAAVIIPLFVKKMMKHESPVINGDGEYSRDFTYIDNVIQANLLAVSTNNPAAVNTVYNVAYGERTTLNQLVEYLKEYLSEFDSEIKTIEIIHGNYRAGDIPHSLASIDKAKQLLDYNPQYSMKQGLKEAVKWYWENLKE